MNPKEQREQTIKDAKCGVILDAARAIFIEKGFWNVKVDDIAAAAGFSKPTLYNYYPDKESILMSLTIREFRSISDKIITASSNQPSFIASAEAMFRVMLSKFIEQFSLIMDLSNYQRMVSMHIGPEKHDDLIKSLKEVQARILDFLEKVIEKGRDSGEITSSLPPNILARFMISLVQGVQMQWKMQGKTGDVDTTLRQLLDFLKHGFGLKG